jgi:hypothetical protein
MSYINSQGNYYLGDRQGNDQEVPQRPGPDYTWNGTEWTIDLSGLKTKQCAAINAARDQAMLAGVTWNGHVWDSDQLSIDNVTSAVAGFSAGIPLPQGFVWRTKDNINVPVLLQDLVGIGAALMQFRYIVYQKSWDLKAEINAATTADEVNAITW